MFGLGTPELIVIMAIAFLVFGGKKLPEIGEGLGKGLKSFKKSMGLLTARAPYVETRRKLFQAPNIGRCGSTTLHRQ